EEQGKKLAERARKYQEEIRNIGLPFTEDAQKKRDALVQDTAKAVGEILSADQVKRFKEVEIQQLVSRTGSPFGDQLIAQYAEITEPLKMTEDQRERLFGGEALDKVLSKDQQEKWTAMKGEEFKARLRRTGFAGPGGFGGGFLA